MNRSIAYKKLTEAKSKMDKAHKAFAMARAEYHKAWEVYKEVDRELKEEEKEVLPSIGEPKKKEYKESKAYREAKKALREMGREEFIKAVEGKK